MKLIKFDLPIGGIKAKNIADLREHFTLEIVDHYRSNRLSKWLQSRNLKSELKFLEGIGDQDDRQLLKSLCDIFSLPSDEESLNKLFERSLPVESEMVIAESVISSGTITDFEHDIFDEEQVFSDISEEVVDKLLTEQSESELSELARKNNLPFSIQNKLNDCASETVRVSLAGNPCLGPELQMRMANLGTPKIRESIAGNPGLEIGVQEYLLETGSDDIKKVIAANSALAKLLQKKVAADSNWRVREALAKNSNIDGEIMELLLEDDDDDVKAALAENAFLLEVLQDKLINSSSEKIRSGLAKNEKVKIGYMSLLADDSSDIVKKSLVKNASLPEALQARFIRDGYMNIIVELARNKSLAVAQQSELASINDIDTYISLFDNPSLCDSVKNDIIKYFSEDGLQRLNEEWKNLNLESWSLVKDAMEASQKFSKASLDLMLGNSFFNSQSKVDKLEADYNYVQGKSDKMSVKCDLLTEKIAKYGRILALKNADQ